MVRLDSGYFVPNEEYGKRFLAQLREDGKPSYNWDHIQACLRACRKRAEVAIDVGAYLGTWTVHLVDHFKYVYAFEPIAANFECLRKNVPAKSSVCCLKIALHNAPTHLMMRPYKPHHPYTWTVGSVGGEDEIKVAAVPLDNMPLQALDLLKVNVCGHELEVIRGAKNHIHAHKPAVLVSENYDPHRKACALLKRWGMKLVWENQRNYLFIWK